MLASVQLVAFIIAAVLIAVGAAFEVRAEVAEARRTHPGLLEWTWIVLPVLMLIGLVIWSGQVGVW